MGSITKNVFTYEERCSKVRTVFFGFVLNSEYGIRQIMSMDGKIPEGGFIVWSEQL
jgi:hypothetical protein|uniref:hypothetical protein n=1 Tax=Enterocloster aldenensis TaxID=358742 RepID=UPI0013F5C25E